MNPQLAFPESFYPPVNPKYMYYCTLGFYIAKRSSCTILGCAKNIAWNLPQILIKLQKIGSMFQSCNYFIYENDSTDNTSLLLQRHSNPSIQILCEKLKQPQHEQDKSLLRRSTMAFCRNKCLQYRKPSTYTIIVDLDLHGISYEGILNTLGHDLDVVGSNGILYKDNKRLYYDTWAHRVGNWEDKTTNDLHFNRGEDPIEVNSCFGGMAIYKSHVLSNCQYTDEDCDHVTLHKQIKDKGFKIYLNPSQITLYSEHYYESYNKY